MPLGRLVTDKLTSFIPNDPVAPQLLSDTIQFIPNDPVRGAKVSEIATTFIPNDPVHPIGLGT